MQGGWSESKTGSRISRKREVNFGNCCRSVMALDVTVQVRPAARLVCIPSDDLKNYLLARMKKHFWLPWRSSAASVLVVIILWAHEANVQSWDGLWGGHRRQSGHHNGVNLESVFNSWASAKVQAVGQFHSPAKILVSSPRDQSSFGQTTLHMAEVAVSRELCSDPGAHPAVW